MNPVNHNQAVSPQNGSVNDYFSQLGLEPFIPEKMQGLITTYQEGLFGTLKKPQIYDVEQYVSSVLQGSSQDDFILLGYAGHAIASFAVHYYIKQDTAAIFIQARYQGPKDSERIQAKLTAAENLLQTKLPDGKKLIAVDSDFTVTRGWQLYDGYPTNLTYRASDDDILFDALTSL